MKPTQVTARATFEFNGDIELLSDLPALLPEGWIITDVTRRQEYVELAEYSKTPDETDHMPSYSRTLVEAKFSRSLV